MVIGQVAAARLVFLVSGFAVYSALITSVSIVLGDEFVSRGAWLDVVILLGLAYGVYRRSRACAVILFVYQVVNRVSMSLITGGLGPLLGVAPITYTVITFLGIPATFVLHRGATERRRHEGTVS